MLKDTVWDLRFGIHWLGGYLSAAAAHPIYLQDHDRIHVCHSRFQSWYRKRRPERKVIVMKFHETHAIDPIRIPFCRP